MTFLEKTRSRPACRISTAELPHGQKDRIRSERHLAWVRQQPCCVPGCGIRHNIQAHHALSGPDPKARSEKAGDNWATPLCIRHHHELHHNGAEQAWAASYGFDIVATAAEFWRRSPASKGHT